MSLNPQPASVTFPALGTSVSVVCTSREVLADAVSVVRTRLSELDRAASRFRADSELARINMLSGCLAAIDPGAMFTTRVGTTLAKCLTAAVHTEQLTDGLVCASLGAELVACGYDEDFAAVRARSTAAVAVSTGPQPNVSQPQRPVAQRMSFDERNDELSLAAGSTLDLGSSAKAWAADAIVDELTRHAAGGFLLSLGGDVATAGSPPPDGWAVGLRRPDDSDLMVVRSTGQALATSSTQRRQWLFNGSTQHHIIDPRTGAPARTQWAQVSCAAPTALQANAASTAAVILDSSAPRWLSQRGIPACLVATDNRVVLTPGWPETADVGPGRAL
ncbi:FAD:protein FMN transferase [Gordonia polyisoprenivorans]|nr:FAD:protein FMN transferase [Gordonia polyisoprenivorans]